MERGVRTDESAARELSSFVERGERERGGARASALWRKSAHLLVVLLLQVDDALDDHEAVVVPPPRLAHAPLGPHELALVNHLAGELLLLVVPPRRGQAIVSLGVLLVDFLSDDEPPRPRPLDVDRRDDLQIAGLLDDVRALPHRGNGQAPDGKGKTEHLEVPVGVLILHLLPVPREVGQGVAHCVALLCSRARASLRIEARPLLSRNAGGKEGVSSSRANEARGERGEARVSGSLRRWCEARCFPCERGPRRARRCPLGNFSRTSREAARSPCAVVPLPRSVTNNVRFSILTAEIAS